MHRYACPCCRYLTLAEEPPGTFEICAVCWWEDDPVQSEDPTYAGGANTISLVAARASFDELGAIDRAALAHVRPPTPEEKRGRASRHR
ncbi:MAG: hydrolase [Deltaproteobacteria bacterium]|nr:hydrolase [Deltaproteobacteria bacterium]